MLKSHALASFAALVLAACGSKSPPAPTPPAGGSGMATGSGSAMGSGMEMGSGSGAAMGSGMEMGSGSAMAGGSATPPPPPPPDPAKIKADLLAVEMDAYQNAKPVFDQYCAKCHTTTGSSSSKKKGLKHFDMTSYPFGGEHALTVGPEIREAIGLTDEKAIMPKDKPGAVKGDDLAKIDTWAQAWIKADEGGAHGAKATTDKLDK